MTAQEPASEGVSIVVATYNGARFLDEQLRSIVAQVGPMDEVVVLDDHSTDETPAILADHAARCPAMTVHRNPRNAGVRVTFERLLGLCTRDVIFLSDQDDVWIEGRKAAMLDALGGEGCVAVLANARIMTAEGSDRLFFAGPAAPDVNSIPANLVRNNFIGCCMAVRREVLAVALPFPRSISMHDWWIGTCAMAIGEVRFLPTPSLLYRRHGGNQSAGARRPWTTVLKDRWGNLRALVALARRLRRRRAAVR